ncbi:MAG: transposase [Clostridiales bacterium]|nr:transposase [Clostridiales bacterium]
MAREKKPVHKVQMTDGKRNIIQQLLQEYDIQSAEDIQDALKDLLGGTIKEMMEAEMDDHLGYEKSERSDSDDYRNGYKAKRINSSYGNMDIQVPQDRKSTFEPQVVKKRQKDISDIDQKIISMYAKGMTTSQMLRIKSCLRLRTGRIALFQRCIQYYILMQSIILFVITG